LMLIMILPVIIALLAFSIGSFVGRAIQFEFIENAFISEKDRTAFESEGYETHAGDYGNNTYRISTVRHKDKDKHTVHRFEEFFTLVPSKAKFSDLKFEYSNSEAVQIINGKLHIMQNRRTSDNKTPYGIEIKAMADVRIIFTLYVEILLTPDTEDHFDYFGFRYDSVKVPAADVGDDDKIRNLIIEGLDTARYDLVYESFSHRDDFLGTLEIDEIEIDEVPYFVVSAKWGFGDDPEKWTEKSFTIKKVVI